MDNKPIIHLTKGQIDKAYAEYVKAKKTKIAGPILDKLTWKNEVEEYLDRHGFRENDTKWSNNAINKANRAIILVDNFTDKQFGALQRSYKRGLNGQNPDEAKFWKDLAQEHKEITPYNLRSHAGIVYTFMENYSGNWKEYFNS